MEDRQEAVRQIHPYQLAEVWPQVLPGLQRLIRKCPDDFTAEHVFWRLMNDRASLFLLGDGFMVLEVDTDPFCGRRTLCVWLLYWLKAEQQQDFIYRELDRLALAANCCRIHFKSPRLGWLKKAKGFKQKLITWERTL